MNNKATTSSTNLSGDFGIVTEPGTLRLERRLPGPIERVWRYLTDAEMRGRWFCSGHMEQREGGHFELIFNNGDLTEGYDPPPAKYAEHDGETRMEGRVVACDPPHLLSFDWFESTGEAYRVTFELTPIDDEVQLVLTHRDLANRDEMIGVAAGWHTHVGILIDVLNERKPPKFWQTLVALEADYELRISEEDVTSS